MQFDATLWLWVGLAGMTAGTLPSAYRLLVEAETRDLTAVLVGITGIASVAYLLMAMGYGFVSIGGTEIEVVRYIDWLLTTPLMVLYLGLLARSGKRVLGALIAVDAVVVLAGIAATATGGVTRYVLFGLGVAAYVGLVWLLMVTLPRRASFDSSRVSGTFTTLRNLTVIVWTLYPVVWLLAPTGTGLLLPETEALVLTYLDIVSKVGFVAVALRGMEVLTDVGAEVSTVAD
jgi:sensory rhodopsin